MLKINKNIRPEFSLHLLVFIIVNIWAGQLLAQDRVFMYLNYYQSEDEQYMVCEVKYRNDEGFQQLVGVPIEFYNNSDTASNKLGEVVTGKNGKARLDFKESDIIRDEDGFAHFESTFAGNDDYRSAKKELATKRVSLAISGEVEDSVKTLTVSGKEIVNGDEIDISDTDIKVFVKRTFSDLPISEGSLDEGSYAFEFPNDLPGDSLGDLQIIARIIEHDDYGTAEVRTNETWGTPVLMSSGERPRALWSRAPLWIIISVTLAFTAAWYHYFLSLSKLFKIRKL
ncbi:MAG: hypothetical protein KDC53_18850 [Saprospiraceae bacterium]|nr:hypothetical protein [Saprospiraceae bacterium]